MASPAGAIPDGWTAVDESGDSVRDIVFPVEGEVDYIDSWLFARGGGRRHLGVDIMGEKYLPLLAARASCVTSLRHGGPGGGNSLTLTDSDGWEYHYVHVNNDTPGTDDGANVYEQAFAVDNGDCVAAGEVVAYLGDSGNAEGSGPHLHFEIQNPDGIWVNPYPSVETARTGGIGACGPIVGPEPTPHPDSGDGYWLLDGAGRVHGVGTTSHGDLDDVRADGGEASEPVAIKSTVAGAGYWILDADGRVFAFGDAGFYGDMSAAELNGPVLGLETPVDGEGYWLVAYDGGVFAFDVPFLGSMGALPLNSPVISMASTQSGAGYWLVAGDGGVFAFGDANFHGSTGALELNTTVTSMAVHPSGDGYWLYARDGGVFAFGVPFYGSIPGLGLCDQPEAVALRGSDTGLGYWVATADGQVFAFGDALDLGGTALTAGESIIDMAVRHHRPMVEGPASVE
ncbi:MAG: peptidoglycan DD-metalloendopeptidase family protein [Actinomycetia bacterium]|nr:peptidoglycan DD-metalloendopeptidase family protein [Actinomycetes bacterium]